MGKVYVQAVVDAFCSLAFAKVYTSKMLVTAAELLYDHVLSFYEALGKKKLPPVVPTEQKETRKQAA